MSKSKSLFLGRFKGLGAWEYEGIIGNHHSFAHAKYGGNPYAKHLFRDQITFCFFWKISWTENRKREPKTETVTSAYEQVVSACWLRMLSQRSTMTSDKKTNKHQHIKNTSKKHRVGLGLCWFCLKKTQIKRIHECLLCLTTAKNLHGTLLIKFGLGLWFANKAQTLEGLPNQPGKLSPAMPVIGPVNQWTRNGIQNTCMCMVVRTMRLMQKHTLGISEQNDGPTVGALNAESPQRTFSQSSKK